MRMSRAILLTLAGIGLATSLGGCVVAPAYGPYYHPYYRPYHYYYY